MSNGPLNEIWRYASGIAEGLFGKKGVIGLAVLVLLGTGIYSCRSEIRLWYRGPFSVNVMTMIDQPPFWYQRRPTHLGDTLFRVCPLVRLEVVNESELPIRVLSYTLSVKSLGKWRTLQALPEIDPFYFAMDGDRSKAREIWLGPDGMLGKAVSDSIPAHGSVQGWAVFQLPKGEEQSCTHNQSLRFDIVERGGGSHRYEVPPLSGLGAAWGPPGGTMTARAGLHDLSRLPIAPAPADE